MHWKELLHTVSALTHNNLALAAAGTILAAAGIGVVLLRRFRKKKPLRGVPWYERLFTLAAIGLGTGMDADGMWTAFRDRLHMGFWECVLLFAFLPVVLVNLSMKARRNFLTSSDEHLSTGRAGKAMWIIAGTSALIASSTATNTTSFLVRFGAPLVVAWLWHEEIVSERAIKNGINSSEVVGVVKRWLVRHGFLSPPAGSLAEIDTARRVAKLATWAYRMHNWPTAFAWIPSLRWNQARTRPSYQRIFVDRATRTQYRLLLWDMYRQARAASPNGVKDDDDWDTPEWARRQPAAPTRATSAAARDIPAATLPVGIDDAAPSASSQVSTEQVLAVLRDQYPGEKPSIGAVKKIVAGLPGGPSSCSQSRAIRLRNEYVKELTAAQAG